MGVARQRLLAHLRRADVHDRFRIYTPVTAAGAPVYVHAKVLVIDDRLLRIGSSNLNNRSMGLDTECDLAIDAAPDAPDAPVIARAVEGLRDMGYLTVGLAGEAPASLREALRDERPPAFVLGAEGKGLRPAVLAACYVAARIPMDPRMESLNVSNAAAIALYEAAGR